MIAVISGDIVGSRQLREQELWLQPLKDLFSNWGERLKDWELSRGDFFQLELEDPELALSRALQVKALIKALSREDLDAGRKSAPIDVRMAIGIGTKTYTGESIKESNGPAYIYAGEKYELLKKENLKLAVKSFCPEFDEEMNLYLRLAGLFMDRWTRSSAELVSIVLSSPEATQEEIGRILGIKQNSVSGRWARANLDELLALEQMYRKKMKGLIV